MTKSRLQPRLGLFALTSILVGGTIGSGIFKKPGIMASYLGSPKLLLAVWVIAGLITLFGALTNAEVAALFPETGGQFVFFQKMYGDFVAYLYGWAIFSVIQTGSIASILYVFSEITGTFINIPHLSPELEKSVVIHLPFIGNIFPLADLGVKSLTLFILFILTAINYRGVRWGSVIQEFFTVLKVAAMLALIIMAFGSGKGDMSHFSSTAQTPQGFSLLGALIAALSGAFWAYDGWNTCSFVAGEVENPQKNMPRGLLLGTLIVIGIYCVINFAYIYILPFNEIAQSKVVATEMARRILGAGGAGFVGACILMSTFGAGTSSVLASARVYFAMAERKMFFPTIAKVHPKFNTPSNALLLQAAWCSVLVMSGTFDMLTDMLIFVTWVFYALGAFGVFVLRKKYPKAHRPYRVWGYPWVPASFVFFASVFVVVTVYNDIMAYNQGRIPIINSVFGLCLVALGAPLFFYFRKKAPSQ
jgi:APA family basic amino acid/polyamine antiporter